MRKFLLECRRRRVFRVAALYIVGAWVMLQVADLAFEAWELPSGLLRQVWLVAFLGFPVALVFGWRYDIVGGRIVRTPERDAEVALGLQRVDFLVLGALAFVIVAMVIGLGKTITTYKESRPPSVASAEIDSRSIAVLPFAVVGASDERAAVLAMGVQDDLLTRLSKISALKVISRTSVERYRGATENVRRIASELGVARVLEGSILSAGDQIRINVQLIDGVTDKHIWADNYDRSLSAENLFDVQSEIVEEIAGQLSATLTQQETEGLGDMPTQNLDAYTAYLKGRQLADVETMVALHAAIEQFESAVELDPGFALAYVGLSDAWLTLAANFIGGISDDESNARAEPPLVRALSLNPNLGQAHATLGFLRQRQGDFAAAEQSYLRAIQLQPSYPRVFRLFGSLRELQGRSDEAMDYLDRALALDPYSAVVNFDLARAYDMLGRFDEALERYLRVVQIEPNHAFAYIYIGAIHYLVYGNIDESLLWYHKAVENDALSPSIRSGQAFAYMELGDLDSARRWVQEALAMDSESFWPVWASLLFNLHQNEEHAALRDARKLIDLYPRNVAGHNVLRNADLVAGRFEAARSRYATAFRELAEPEAPDVNRLNYTAAVDFALVLQKLGEHDHADRLLQQSLEVVRPLPRHGIDGFWITDVQILALLGREQEALAALREAIDDGWRYNAWYLLDYDMNVASLRSEPEFVVQRNRVKADLERQAERVRELQASGEL
jgi:TolB-like protein/Flp pilus assembly protein TadD